MSPFQFGTYSLRPATKDDHALLAKLIAEDPDHRDKVQPEFFYTKEPGIESYVLCDTNGDVRFFFRMTRVMRVDIQFGPVATVHDRANTREALTDGFVWLMAQAKRASIRQIIFESVSRPLVNLCKRRFRFKASPNEFVCGIAAPKPVQSHQDAGNQVHQPPQERG